MPSHIGTYLRTIREIKNLSIDDLARIAGVTSGHIGRIERGESLNPRHETVEALAKALKVHPNELLYGESLDQQIVSKLEQEPSDIPEKLIKYYFFVPLLSGNIVEKDFEQPFEDWKWPTQAVAKDVYNPRRKYLAWKIKGKSLEPGYSDTDILIIELTNPEFPYKDNSTVVAAYQDGKVTIGHLKFFNDTVEFRPLNKEFPAIQGKSQKHIKILGGIRGLIRKYKW